MVSLYSIKGWNAHFEVSQIRKVENARWVPLPVKHDGLSFRRLMAMEDGQAIYGAWVLIVQVAAKCPVRGVLADEHGPLTAEDLALKTGCPEPLFKKALKALSSPAIGWLVVNSQTDTSSLPLQEKTGEDRTKEEKTKEEDCSEPPKAASEPPSEWVFPTVGVGQKTWTLPPTKLGEFKEAFPGIDAAAELRKARQWCRDNPAKRKTATGMLKFLNRWLSRAQDAASKTSKASPPQPVRARVPTDDELARWNPHDGGAE